MHVNLEIVALQLEMILSDWVPDIAERKGRRYTAVADALAEDIQAGKLRPGDRLPTHRELAYRTGLSVSTISKAYAEAVRRQHIRSEVGRGTFVLPNAWSVVPNAWSAQPRVEVDQASRIDLTFNCPVQAPMHTEAMSNTLREIAEGDRLSVLMPYHRPWGGLEEHRAAAALWLEKRNMHAHPNNIVITNGAQHAASCILAALIEPGEIVATEELTDPGIKFLTSNRHLPLKGLPIDRQGIIPDAFESACRSMRIRALFCVPNHQSPTLSVMPVERRREIAVIAERHGVTIIENDVYGPFIEDPPPALSSFAPDNSYYFTSLSKCVCPGLRIGFLAAPPGRVEELIPGLGATMWMASLFSAEVASIWIRDGTADRLTSWQRQEMARRQKLAAQVLRGFEYRTLPAAMHIWLPLPDPWRVASFVVQARGRGISVAPAEAFVVGHVAAPQAVRISLGGATPAPGELQRGLQAIAELLRARPPATFLIM